MKILKWPTKTYFLFFFREAAAIMDFFNDYFQVNYPISKSSKLELINYNKIVLFSPNKYLFLL